MARMVSNSNSLTSEESQKLFEHYSYLGYNHRNAGKWELSIENFLHALQLKEDVNLYNALGNAYLKLNQLDLAVEAYLSAIQLEPTLPGLHFNLGNIYSIQQQYQLAITSI